uniref:Serine/threonine-protein kinase 1 n=1 Tax=Setaria digitata TaxID=48799 RepID=A0A915PHG9_9BILA
MLCRRLQDLTYCISYNVNFLNDKAHGAKQFRKKYTILEELGRGGFGIVYKAERNDDSAPVAVKFIEHRRKCKQLIPTEICLLDICRSVPGVVQLIDWFANSKGFLIVMERPEQCLDLFDLISIYGYLDENIARSIFVQILNTTCLLYNTYGIFHRDIKDENIIINMHTGEAILVDFGAAALISEACIKEFQGTRSYCPPEWFKRLAYMPLEATVWSLDCENLLRQCLAVTPSRRPDLLEIFKHRWLNQPIVVHSEPFKVVLQQNLQKRKETERQKKLKGNGIEKDSVDNVNDCAARKNYSANSNISIPNTPTVSQLPPQANNVLNSEFLKKHRRHSSYDNIVMSVRTDMFALRDCYEADNNVLIRPASIEEETDDLEPNSDSLFCSACESFSIVSTDPQNSESYITTVEDDRGCSFQESKEAVVVETFNKMPLTQTFSFRDNGVNNNEKEEIIQTNCPDRPAHSNQEEVMNSRLIAKQWLQNIATTSKYGSFSSNYEEQGLARKQTSVGSNCLGIFSIKSRRLTAASIATVVSK